MSDTDRPLDPLDDPHRYFAEHVPASIARRGDLSAVLGDLEAVAEVVVEGPEGGTWHFAIGAGEVRLEDGPHEAPTFTVRISLDTFRRLRSKELAPRTAFMMGKVKLFGRKSTAMRLAALLLQPSAPR